MLQDFDSLFLNAPIGIFRTGVDGRYLQINPALALLYGYDSPEELMATLTDIATQLYVDPTRRQAFISQVEANGTVHHFESEVVCRDGSYIWISESARVVKDEQGSVLYYEGFVENITERKQAETQLQQNEELYSSVVAALSEGVTFQTTDTEILDCNRSAERILGLTRDQIIGRTSLDPRWRSLRDDGSPFPGTEHPSMVTLQTGQPQEGVIMGVHQPDGNLVWISINAQPLFRRRDRILYGVVTSFSDITARRQAEIQLEQMNAELNYQVEIRTGQLSQALEFESLLRRITDKIRDTLDETQILQTVVQELGMALDGIFCDLSFCDVLHTVSTVKFEYTTLNQSRLGVQFDQSQFPEIYHQLRQGQPIHLCVLPTALPEDPVMTRLVCPIPNDQGTLGELCVGKLATKAFSDLEIALTEQVASQCGIAIRQARLYQTAQRQVMELEQLNQLKDEFVATVSHELRTPLTTMRMAIRMLQLPPNQFERGSKQQQYLTTLEQECNREITLINSLLDLQKFELHSQGIRLDPIRLPVWLPKLISSFQDQAERQQLTLTWQIEPTLPLLTSDSVLLERVIHELLTNALKYTPQNHHINVLASLTQYPQPIEIQVINTGVDLIPDQLSRLFEKFYRAPQPDPWKQGGTGLGLALAKQMMERLEGSISVQGAEGKLIFCLRLPLQHSASLKS